MAKLAPSPSLPMDLLPTEKRRESELLPNSTPLPERGPEINRAQERSALLASLNTPRTSPEVLGSQPAPAHLPAGQTKSPEAQSPSPLPSQSTTGPTPQSQETSLTQTGFFSRLKDTFLKVTGLDNTQNPESKAETPGFLSRVITQVSRLSEVRSLSDLASWAKGMVYAAAPKLCAWARPTPKVMFPESLNIKSMPTYSPGEAWNASPETTIMTPAGERRLSFSATKSSGSSLTEQALTSVAAATQARAEEREKKQSLEDADGRRNKEGAQAALRKLQLEGLSALELAEISAELSGVYGTAEVALRNARELLTRKKTT